MESEIERVLRVYYYLHDSPSSPLDLHPPSSLASRVFCWVSLRENERNEGLGEMKRDLSVWVWVIGL